MLSSLLESMQNPVTRHAALVHIPLALAMLGILPLLAAAITRFRNRTLVYVCAAWFLVAAGSAFAAAQSGEDAEDVAQVRGLSASASKALHEHEELGENGWMWMLIPAAFSAGALIPRRSIAVASGCLAIAGAAGVGVWAANTGHSGGQLVYAHGVNVGAVKASTPAE